MTPYIIGGAGALVELLLACLFAGWCAGRTPWQTLKAIPGAMFEAAFCAVFCRRREPG